MANVGDPTEPVDKTNYKAKTEMQLFAHNALQEEVDTFDPRNLAGALDHLPVGGRLTLERKYHWPNSRRGNSSKLSRSFGSDLPCLYVGSIRCFRIGRQLVVADSEPNNGGIN